MSMAHPTGQTDLPGSGSDDAPNEVHLFKCSSDADIPAAFSKLNTIYSRNDSDKLLPTTGFPTVGIAGWRTSLLKTANALHAFNSNGGGAQYSHYMLPDGGSTWVQKLAIGFGWGYPITPALLKSGLVFFNSIIENSNNSYLYNADTDTAIQVASSRARHHYTPPVVLDNGLVVMSGSGYGNTDVEAYDSSSNTWFDLPALPLARQFATCALPGNRILAVTPSAQRAFILTFGDGAWVEVSTPNVPNTALSLAYCNGLVFALSSDDTIRSFDADAVPDTWDVVRKRKGLASANGGITTDGNNLLYFGFGESASTSIQTFAADPTTYDIIAAMKIQ